MSGMKERNNEEKLAALSRTSLEEHRHPSDMLQLQKSYSSITMRTGS